MLNENLLFALRGSEERHKKEPPGDQRVNKHLLNALILQLSGWLFFLAALPPGLLSTSSRAGQRALPADSSTVPFSWGLTAHHCPTTHHPDNPSPP